MAESMVNGGMGAGTSFSLGAASVAPPRTVVIQRSAPSQSAVGIQDAGARESIREMNLKANIAANLSAGVPGHAQQLQEGVKTLVETRSTDKSSLQDLNDRFSNYIDKVRTLEVENAGLVEQLALLKDQWGKETSKVKADCDDKLENLRKQLTNDEKDKAEIEVKMSSLEDKVGDLQELIEEARKLNALDQDDIIHLNQLLHDYETELDVLKKKVGNYDSQKDKCKTDIENMRKELRRLRGDLENETLNHIKAENDVQSLREELEFLKVIQEAELKELQVLAYRDTSENKDFWKNEMEQALQDLQDEYNNKLESIKKDMEAQYEQKLQEQKVAMNQNNVELTKTKETLDRLKEQQNAAKQNLPELEAKNAELEFKTNALRREIEEMKRNHHSSTIGMHKDLTEYRHDLDNMLRELQNLMNAKNSLELEISTYRKLLESEESRVSRIATTTTTGNVGTYYSSHSASAGGGSSGGVGEFDWIPILLGPDPTQVKKDTTEKVRKTKFSYNGEGSSDVCISECKEDGKLLKLKNKNASENYDIGGWTINVDVDSGTELFSYEIPRYTTVHAGQEDFKIWARGQKPHDSYDLESDLNSFGIGAIVKLTLKDINREVKYTLTRTSGGK